MSIALVADAEKIIGDYLRAHADIVALGTRVVGETPSSIAPSWIRLTQISAPSTDRSDHLVPFYLQLDCYASKQGIDGSPQKEAALIARTVRAVLQEAPDVTHTGATVSRVQITSDARVPDGTQEPARERRIITCIAWMHA